MPGGTAMWRHVPQTGTISGSFRAGHAGEASPVNTPLRATLALLVFFGSFVFIRLLLLVLLPADGAAWLGSILALVAALVAARITWVRGGVQTGSKLRSALLGAAALGGIGFALGFFGPMIFAPGANQGPMLGIFVTGPAGALLGAVLGLALGTRVPKR